jgi:hypothetical protein
VSVRILLRRLLVATIVVAAAGLAWKGARTFQEFRPAAITLGPNTTIYFGSNPTLVTRVHEAIHRRQMAEKSLAGRLASAVRYNFDYNYRLDEEAEAKAGEICLQIHKFSAELPAYTTARSRSQAEVYRAWAWEKIGGTVPDRVGEKLRNGERCQEILAGALLDLPPGEELSEEEALKLAAFRFLQSWGSGETEVATWKARLQLADWTAPVRWRVAEESLPFWLLEVARPLAAEADSTLDAQLGGEALHRLTYYQARRMYSQLLPPQAAYRNQPLLPEGADEGNVGLRVERWPTDLLGRALGGSLSEEAVAWLQRLTEHPLHSDFETFALAPGADILGTRYRLPVEGEWGRLVPTELGPVREAFQAQWGRIALAAHGGDLDEAERVLRTVVAGAVQLAMNAPFEEDVLEALVFLDRGLRSLAELSQARDGEEPAWAQRLGAGPPAAWTRGHRLAVFSEDPAVIYQALPQIARDEAIPHAFKKFAYRQVVLFDECMGLRQDTASRLRVSVWRSAVEAGLVRRESDGRVLEMMRGGVRDLIVASDVNPGAICAPSTVVQPLARIAIISSPPRSRQGLLASRSTVNTNNQ